MRHPSIAALAVIGFISATAAGCAAVPQADIDAAKAAAEQSVTAGAADYAQDSYRAVQDAQTALDAELAAQADKFALTRSYSKATELAAELKAAGEHAAQEAIVGRELAKDEAMTLIADAKTALTQAQQMLAKAPKGKGTAQDLAALKADLDTAAASITEAETAFATDAFRDAMTKAEAAKAAAANVIAAIQQAMAARGGR
jgi:hypothetical protein